MAEKRKRKLNKQEAKKASSVFDEFNKLSKAFIKLLSQKVETKKKSVHTLSIMVSDMKIPEPYANTTINIQTLDINNTKVKKKGSMSYNQKMDWEDDVRKKNRGIIL
jgi:hypothetical protein